MAARWRVLRVSHLLHPALGTQRCPPAAVPVLKGCANRHGTRPPRPQVRQSAFALVGDLARCCISAVAARLGELVALAAANLDPRVATAEGNNSASNNACWALGEVAIKVGLLLGRLLGRLLGLLGLLALRLPAWPAYLPPAARDS